MTVQSTPSSAQSAICQTTVSSVVKSLKFSSEFVAPNDILSACIRAGYNTTYASRAILEGVIKKSKLSPKPISPANCEHTVYYVLTMAGMAPILKDIKELCNDPKVGKSKKRCSRASKGFKKGEFYAVIGMMNKFIQENHRAPRGYKDRNGRPSPLKFLASPASVIKGCPSRLTAVKEVLGIKFKDDSYRVKLNCDKSDNQLEEMFWFLIESRDNLCPKLDFTGNK